MTPQDLEKMNPNRMIQVKVSDVLRMIDQGRRPQPKPAKKTKPQKDKDTEG